MYLLVFAANTTSRLFSCERHSSREVNGTTIRYSTRRSASHEACVWMLTLLVCKQDVWTLYTRHRLILSLDLTRNVPTAFRVEAWLKVDGGRGKSGLSGRVSSRPLEREHVTRVCTHPSFRMWSSGMSLCCWTQSCLLSIRAAVGEIFH